MRTPNVASREADLSAERHLRACDAEQLPGIGDTFEVMHASVVELDPRAGDKIPHCSRYQNLSWLCEGFNPLPDVHADAAQIVTSKFDFARVDAATQFDSEALGCVAHGERGLNCPGRAVEAGKEAVPCGLDLSTSKPLQLVSYERVVLVEDTAPTAVTEFGSLVGGTHDVGKEERRQSALRDLVVPAARQELFNLFDYCVGIALPGFVVHAGELHELGTRDLSCHVTAVLHVDEQLI
jgi:hypothetical protein